MIEKNLKRGGDRENGPHHPHHHHQHQRANTPDPHVSCKDPPASPLAKSLHWSIADMTIKQQQEHSYRGRSSSLPFLTLKDLPKLQQPPVLRVVLLGTAGVGKSSLLMQFASSFYTDVSDYESMLSDNPEDEFYEKTVEIDGQITTLHIMDTPSYGQADFEEKEEQYLSDGDAYLLVYSVTDRRSFKKANELRFKLQRTKETETVPIILVGNKTDLERSREVSFAEGKHFAALFDCKLIETSAAISHNVDQLFHGVVRQFRLRSRLKSDEGEEESGSRGSMDSTGKVDSPCRGSSVVQKRRRSSMLNRARGVLERILRRRSADEPPGYRARSKSCHVMEVL
ncbi:ras-related protein Rap-2b-like [Patiria miniata]|uniref:GTP-binding protein REM 2 n=1 Tax=Patiria miniata TaxID=46514 RepID=A0A914B0S3_PATMI|nr:ras-related protein Rap-2b-like [Patiria miniata]